MRNAPLKGIVPAVVTPFREKDELIDYTAWQSVIENLIASGVHGLFVIGGQGEFFSLDQEEREVAARFCVQTVAGRVPVYANVGCVTTRRTVRLAQKAEADGVDYIVVITPYYVKPSAAELVEHYVEVCRSVRIPVLAYNIPERTDVELTPDILRSIAAQCDNFVGLKDSSGNLDLIPEYVASGLTVFIGRDHLILEGLKRGAAGAVTACANVVPRAFVDLYNAYMANDLETAARLQALIEPLRRAFSLATFPSVVKEAMNQSGMRVGNCRRPVGPMPAEARYRLAEVLAPLREAGYLPAVSQKGSA
ncbi:MAG TPA: dihydrodipicolinate synthase family protein [Bryobacteraceae bacterium]|nr:dihydrodipicolinate synthase family protein [Bryobacteraceae bacterium]HOL69803.1 dihydrodipicolinate synthase family protein [Bryobacteraceae bacterium]HOQ45177.1 dihydrodipicolinate synthase family protein [Bryobacteraceae bacterium]HPQ16126.1 dihydrodipicolinate synthase family protein [Bryobacteraceae bacterium]HPU71249.1 dihydrodipicolinate synthase family protein [Bryobacteraceae bacterium]